MCPDGLNPMQNRSRNLWCASGAIESVLHHPNRVCPCLYGRPDPGSAKGCAQARQGSSYVRRSGERQEHRAASTQGPPEGPAQGRYLGVWRLDRLGRGLRDLIQLTQDLEGRGIGLESLTEKIDTVSTPGKPVFHVFAALAEFERN